MCQKNFKSINNQRSADINFFRIAYQNKEYHCLKNPEGYQLIKGDIFTNWELTDKIIRNEAAELLLPVRPSKIIAVGLNYYKHAQELNMPLPSVPLIFLKPNTTLVASGQNILKPAMSDQVDYEGELALIIGEKTRNVLEEKALQYLFGYTLANDVTARDLQKIDAQWTRAKSFDSFCPLGPSIATEVDIDKLEFTTYVNGELKQTGRPSDFIFSVSKIISFISQIMTLLPGDVILTGTPAGIGSMQIGDKVQIICEQIGVLENKLQ